jgi:propionyl-CoA carboxylase alpha chain
MHYDSMIAKLIVHGRDRQDAIARMREALNAFVIRGIHSNIPFQAALLAHPEFVAGRFNTGFIAQHFGQGFTASMVRHDTPVLLRVLAAAFHGMHRRRASGITGQLVGHAVQAGQAFVVVTDLGQGQTEHLPVQMHLDGDAMVVTVEKQTYRVAFYSALRDTVLHARINSQPICAQVERRGLAYRVGHNGAQIEAKVLSPRAAALSKRMLFKSPPDMSKFLVSPMPGLLRDVAVKVGQKVLAGEKLAVIEAMKMENILVATQDAVVAEVSAHQGESLAVDQVILRFA